MSTPSPAGIPDHDHRPPSSGAQPSSEESASDADAGDVTPAQADPSYDEPGDSALANEDDDD